MPSLHRSIWFQRHPSSNTTSSRTPFTVDRIYATKISARRHVAFKAYCYLYEAALLNDYLLPISSILEPEREDEVKEMLADVEKREKSWVRQSFNAHRSLGSGGRSSGFLVLFQARSGRSSSTLTLYSVRNDLVELPRRSNSTVEAVLPFAHLYKFLENCLTTISKYPGCENLPEQYSGDLTIYA